MRSARFDTGPEFPVLPGFNIAPAAGLEAAAKSMLKTEPLSRPSL
jgi:hypothetical protein